MSKPKVIIDQKALQSFFTEEKISEAALKAVNQVITVVIIKHFAKYFNIVEDLRSMCLLKILEIKPRYDLSFSAYNYVYTACRNEIGNYLNKQRELIVEDILPLSNASVVPDVVSLPAEVNKFKRYLTGEQDFTVIELSKKDAINLVLFCELHSSSRKVTPPEYVQNKEVIPIMYKLLLKL